MMKIRTRLDGKKLYVKEISGDHNHELSEVFTFDVCILSILCFNIIPGDISPHAEAKTS